jgi:hypothetical protein
MKVSSQVTDIRKDPWAVAQRIGVEKDISDNEWGYYIHPKLHSQPPDRGNEQFAFATGNKNPTSK